MRWVERYCRIPFVDEGSSFGGCHCWGLVRLVYANELGIELAPYAGIAASDTGAVTGLVSSERGLAPWQQVIERGNEKAFDVVVMRGVFPSGGRKVTGPVHVGVVVAPGHVLHVMRGMDSVCVPMSHPRVTRRVLSIHRHEALT